MDGSVNMIRKSHGDDDYHQEEEKEEDRLKVIIIDRLKMVFN